MSDGEESSAGAALSTVPVDPGPAEPDGTAPLAPRVRWGRAAALHLGAGFIAGFVVPIIFFQLKPADVLQSAANTVIITVILVIGAAIIAGSAAAVPFLVAWISWLIVSRRGRRLRTELLAVILGAFGGALVPSLVPFLFLALLGVPDWANYPIVVLILGGPAALAFALWVADAWRRAH